MSNYYVVSSGSYSDYSITFIFKAPKELTQTQIKQYYLEGVKQSSDFEDKQNEKLAKILKLDKVNSTNYFNDRKLSAGLSFQEWEKLLKDGGVEQNPHDWLVKILTKNGCEIISYEEFNMDDWD